MYVAEVQNVPKYARQKIFDNMRAPGGWSLTHSDTLRLPSTQEWQFGGWSQFCSCFDKNDFEKKFFWISFSRRGEFFIKGGEFFFEILS